jgi:hypothetical protein
MILAEQHDEWQVCHRCTGTELLAKVRMAIVDGESEERREVIGGLVAALMKGGEAVSSCTTCDRAAPKEEEPCHWSPSST